MVFEILWSCWRRGVEDCAITFILIHLSDLVQRTMWCELFHIKEEQFTDVSFIYFWHQRRWSRLQRKRSSSFVWNVIKYLIEFGVFKIIKASQHVVQSVHDASTSFELELNCCNTRRILSTQTAPPVIWNFVILEITTNINEMFIMWIQTDAPPALKNSQPVNV